VVRPSEGNGARLEGQEAVGALHSTEDAGEPSPGDPVEGRGCWVIGPLEGKMAGMPSPENVSTRLQRIAELARNAPDMAFTNLAHHIDEGFLHEAYRLTRKDGAVGTDGTTATEYERQLQGNLRSLLDRFKSGTYQAPAVRRSHVPKGDGSKRPIGIPTFEDKVLQRAVLMVMEAVYEQEFLECSFGFRCGRSAHQGLEMVWQGLMRMGGVGCWRWTSEAILTVWIMAI